MGKIYRVEAASTAQAGSDLKTALLKAAQGDVLRVPPVAMQLKISGGILEIEEEGRQ